MAGATRDFTPSDTAIEQIGWFMITTAAGDVTYRMEGGRERTISDAPANVWMPIKDSTTIMATGTTAVGFVVF